MRKFQTNPNSIFIAEIPTHYFVSPNACENPPLRRRL